MCDVPFRNDQDHIALIGRYRSAWRRYINQPHAAPPQLTIASQHDGDAQRVGYCHFFSIMSHESSVVELWWWDPCIAMKRRPPTNQAARRRRQRKIPVGRRLGNPGWPNHRTHAESSQMQCACEVEIALKSKYP